MARIVLFVVVIATWGCRDREPVVSPPPPPPPRAEAPRPAAPPPAPAPAPAGLPCFADVERVAVPGGTISALVTGDLDRDGAPDVVVVNDRDGLDAQTIDVDAEQIVVLRNDGHGRLAAGDPMTADKSTLGITLGDLDGNGTLDAVTSAVVFDGTARSSLHVYLGRGDGAFDSAWTGAITNESSADAIADITGDGVPDLVVTAPNHVDVYATGAGRKLARASRMRAGRYPQEVKPVDLDGDGDLDLAFLGHVSYELMISINRGRGGFAPPTTIKTCVSPSGLAIDDFDRDGKLDALVSCIGVRLADGKVIAPAQLALASDVGAAAPTLVPLTVEPVHHYVVRDLDADGAPDVVGTRDEDTRAFEIRSHVAVLHGDGRGRLVELGAVEVPGQLGGITATDLDRDGQIDVVVPMWTGREPFVLVWRGRSCTAVVKTT